MRQLNDNEKFNAEDFKHDPTNCTHFVGSCTVFFISL